MTITTAAISPSTTTYVNKPSDFGTTGIINGETYYFLQPGQYLITQPLTLVNGLTTFGGGDVVIKSLNKIDCPITWDGFTTEPIVTYNGPDLLEFDHISFINIAGGTNTFMEITSGLGKFNLKNCEINNFNVPITCSGTPQVKLINNDISCDGAADVYEATNVAESVIQNNRITFTSTENCFNFLGNSVMNGNIFGNTINNNAGYIINIANTITFPPSMFCLNNNIPSVGANFFNPGGLDETQPGVEAFLNPTIKNSQALAGATDFTGTVVEQTIVTMGVAVIVEGLTFTTDLLTERFQGISSGVPAVYRFQYDGEPRTFVVTVSCILMTVAGNADIAVGIFVNDVALTSSFLVSDSDNVDPNVHTSKSLVSLTSGDQVKIGVLNDTGTGNLNMSNARFFLTEPL